MVKWIIDHWLDILFCVMLIGPFVYLAWCSRVFAKWLDTTTKTDDD